MVISPRSRLNESVSVSDQMRSAKSGSSAVGTLRDADRRQRRRLQDDVLTAREHGKVAVLRRVHADVQARRAVLHEPDVGAAEGCRRQRVVVDDRARVRGAGMNRLRRPQLQCELVVLRVVVLHGRDGQLEGIARGEYLVLVESGGGVVHRGNGGGVPEADALGLDGDLAERVDGLLAGGRLTVRAVAGGARGQAPCPDGHLQKRMLGVGGRRGALIYGAAARRETDARRLRPRRPGGRRQQHNRGQGGEQAAFRHEDWSCFRHDCRSCFTARWVCAPEKQKRRTGTIRTHSPRDRRVLAGE